jgi:hypothetical protein
LMPEPIFFFRFLFFFLLNFVLKVSHSVRQGVQLPVRSWALKIPHVEPIGLPCGCQAQKCPNPRWGN